MLVSVSWLPLQATSTSFTKLSEYVASLQVRIAVAFPPCPMMNARFPATRNTSGTWEKVIFLGSAPPAPV